MYQETTVEDIPTFENDNDFVSYLLGTEEDTDLIEKN